MNENVFSQNQAESYRAYFAIGGVVILQSYRYFETVIRDTKTFHIIVLTRVTDYKNYHA